MKKKFLNLIFSALFAVSAISTISAETFTLATGETYEGELYKIFEGQAYLKNGADEKITVPVTDFDDASQAKINGWAEKHPESVDVYTKWDKQPVIKQSVMPDLPDQFHTPEFKGMVSVDLVLDQKGKVMFAKVRKSTHPELESPSLEAAKTWKFEPAKIGGKSVKSKLRVPFKFTFNPKA